MTSRDQEVEELQRTLCQGWREENQDLVYHRKRWFRPGDMYWEQVELATIYQSIEDYIESVQEESATADQIQSIYETALIDCYRESPSGWEVS
jgi:hypothetical protein